jgi:hypothetical protein
MSKIEEIIAYQTGEARVNNTTLQDAKPVIVDNIQLTRRFLKHSQEAEGEMLDFKDMFGHLFTAGQEFSKYKIILSIGSTSTQGWEIDDKGDYKVIIPEPSDNSHKIFESLGAKNKINFEALRKLKSILDTKQLNETNKKVLCVNAVGYLVDKRSKQPINLFSINLNNKNIYNIGQSTPPTSQKIDIKFIAMLNLTLDNLSKCIDIFPRELNIKDKNGTDQKLGGQWARGLSIKENKRVIDIGGGSVSVYNSYERPILLPNINPNEIYDGTYTDEKDNILLNMIISKLPKLSATNIGGYKSKKRKSKKRKSKKRKSKKY